MQQANIVIVGGGAGGLELATMLGNKLGKTNKARIMLVDGKLTHFWKPLLHEVAAGTINVHHDELSYAAHAAEHYFEFHLGYMDGIDREQQLINIAATTNAQGETIIPNHTIHYDYLVIAVGSVTNDFGTEGVREHCLYLDSQQQAQNFQRTFLERWMIANTQTEPLREGQLSVAIAGAGATGVELAAELHTAVHEMLAHTFRKNAEAKIDFTIIDAASRVLPALPEAASASIERELRKLKIDVLTNEMICKATKDGFHTKSGKFIAAEIKIWAAGVKAPNWLNGIGGLESSRNNQLVVNSNLQTTRDEKIFVIGDCCSYTPAGETQPIPPRAQAAHQQAQAVFKSLCNLLDGKDLVEFVYKDQGSLINMSDYSTVGSIVGRFMGKQAQFKVEGYFASKAYVSLYRMHQYKLHGFWWVLLMMIADRITRGIRPRLKLH